MTSELSDFFNQKIRPHYPLGLTTDLTKQNYQTTTNTQQSKTEENVQDTNVEKEETKKHENTEKSFHIRNKGVLAAITAAGVTLLGLRTYNIARSKSFVSKELSKILDNLSEASRMKFKTFTKNFKKSSDNTEILNNILKEKDEGLKLAVIKHIINDSSKINEKNWETIYNSLVELKPTEKIEKSVIEKTVSNFLSVIDLNKNIRNSIPNKMLASIKSDKIEDSIKLQIGNKLLTLMYISKLSPNEKIQICKDLMSMIKNNTANEFCWLAGRKTTRMRDKFSLGCNVLERIESSSLANIATVEEQFEFAKYLKKLGKETKIIKGNVFGNSYHFNNLNILEIKLKCQKFNKDFSDNTTIEEIEKFSKEVLNDYKNANDTFIESSKIIDGMLKKTMKMQFEDKFMLPVYLNIEKLKKSNMHDAEKFRKIEQLGKEIQNNIEEFGKKYFNINPNYKHTNTGSKSNYDNARNFVKGKEAQSKKDLIDLLSKDKDFEQAVEQIKTGKLDIEFIKKLKKKIVIKYHPDRVGAQTEEEQQKATALFQKLNGLIEILEKIYS